MKTSPVNSIEKDGTGGKVEFMCAVMCLCRNSHFYLKIRVHRLHKIYQA